MYGECSGQPASRLLQVKMNILPYATCRLVTQNLNNAIHICAGSAPTSDAGACQVC